MPRNMLIVPSVTMNGGSLSLVMSVPFNRPQIKPVKIPATPAKHAIDAELPPEPAANITSPPIIPETAIMEPTDRSMPAEMIMKVIPTEMMPGTEERLSTFVKLSSVRNVSGLMADRVATISNKVPKGRS